MTATTIEIPGLQCAIATGAGLTPIVLDAGFDPDAKVVALHETRSVLYAIRDDCGHAEVGSGTLVCLKASKPHERPVVRKHTLLRDSVLRSSESGIQKRDRRGEPQPNAKLRDCGDKLQIVMVLSSEYSTPATVELLAQSAGLSSAGTIAEPVAEPNKVPVEPEPVAE